VCVNPGSNTRCGCYQLTARIERNRITLTRSVRVRFNGCVQPHGAVSDQVAGHWSSRQYRLLVKSSTPSTMPRLYFHA
jgi:hypothetical protein